MRAGSEIGLRAAEGLKGRRPVALARGLRSVNARTLRVCMKPINNWAAGRMFLAMTVSSEAFATKKIWGTHRC
jgi:hypothetical protein